MWCLQLNYSDQGMCATGRESWGWVLTSKDELKGCKSGTQAETQGQQEIAKPELGEKLWQFKQSMWL